MDDHLYQPDASYIWSAKFSSVNVASLAGNLYRLLVRKANTHIRLSSLKHLQPASNLIVNRKDSGAFFGFPSFTLCLGPIATLRINSVGMHIVKTRCVQVELEREREREKRFRAVSK